MHMTPTQYEYYATTPSKFTHRLLLLFTYRRSIAMGAHTTLSTTQNKWHSNSISNLEFHNASTNLDDYTAHFMPWYEWETVLLHVGNDVGIVTFPSMVIRSTNTGGHNLNNDSERVVGGIRAWYIIDSYGTGEGSVDCGFHDVLMLMSYVVSSRSTY